jgi:hypothetical protein
LVKENILRTALLSNTEFEKLKTAVEWSIQQLGKPRENRIKALKQYVTSHYSEGGAEKRVPTNFLELAITIYSRQLAPKVPQCMITTKLNQLKPAASQMESALNQIPKEINLVETVRNSVMEAMFSMGVVKVGIAATGKNMQGDRDVGETYVEVVGFDDYFMDMSAKKHSLTQFEGNDYWMPLQSLRDSGLYTFDDGSEIVADDMTLVNEQGDEQSNVIAITENAELYQDQIWLRDVWIKASRKIVTYSITSGQQIRCVNWDGPDDVGPYIRLGFSHVPGNLLPLPPVALWTDLHDLGNSLFRKLAKQADSFKSVATFSGGNDESVLAFQNAADGDGIRYTGAKPERATAGGIDQPTLAFFLQVRNLYSYFAGNLDSLGGLAPMTETVGQDKLLAEAASSRMKFMAEKTVGFLNEIFKALAWFEWTDPVRKRIVTRNIGDNGFTIDSEWSAETREGDFLDYNFDIDVYSIQDDSPDAKLRRVDAIFERYILPAGPLIEGQGGKIDVQALLALVAKLSDTPEINDLVKFEGDDPRDQAQPHGNPNPQRQPATNTTHTYERVSRSAGGTQASKDNVLSQQLLGGNVQDSQKSQLGA